MNIASSNVLIGAIILNEEVSAVDAGQSPPNLLRGSGFNAPR